MYVTHELDPFYDSESRILILGSIPSSKSREEGFYYAHPQNRFYRVLANVYEEKVPITLEEKKEFLKSHHIALFDCLASCNIKASLDSSIRNPIPNDINEIIESSKINKIYTTGKTAFKLYNKYIMEKTKIEAIPLPSTSPLNCRISFDDLVLEYKKVIQDN